MNQLLENLKNELAEAEAELKRGGVSVIIHNDIARLKRQIKKKEYK